jgi:gliding motility associated protien GldN
MRKVHYLSRLMEMGVLVLLISLAEMSFGQGLLNPPQPINYPPLREADVMWSKTIWRIIDLKEKINLPLGQPPSGSGSELRPLIDVLLDAVKDGPLTAYSYVDDHFTLPMPYREIEERGGARIDTEMVSSDLPPYDPIPTAIHKTFNRDDVVAYRLKEVWYFDKERSLMDVRILGIAPLVYARDQEGNIRADNAMKLLCWFSYKEARPVLATALSSNRWNNSQLMSFDAVFQKRFFNSYIYKESNVYDRRIDDYKEGIATLYESERIKDEIANLEHDMWEY